MPSIGLSFFILGLVVASATADEATASNTSTSALGVPAYPSSVNDSSPITVAATNDSDINRTSSNPSVSNDTSSVNVTNTDNTNNTDSTNSTDAPSTTKGNDTSNVDQVSQSTTPTAKPESPGPPEITPTPTTMKDKENTTPTLTSKTSGDKTGIIILIVIILVAFVVGLVCFFAKKRGRRYSVDFTSRPDEANIPLSTIDPEVPADAAPQNGLQTFASTETETAAEEGKEPEEPAEKPEVKDEPKAEADKSAVDPSAESAALPPPPDSSDDKPKEDVAEESLPPPPAPAPVEPTVEEKTDDEGAVSNKTSVESLKETNENNSNNSDFSQQGDTKSDNIFWDIPLNSPL
ncbi:uncharacterized protein AB9X84_008179 [Acanthopagrus schlegelii]